MLNGFIKNISTVIPDLTRYPHQTSGGQAEAIEINEFRAQFIPYYERGRNDDYGK